MVWHYLFSACVATPLKLRRETPLVLFKHHFLCMQITWTLQFYSQARWRQNKRKNRRKDSQLFQKIELKYVKQGSADCQNTGVFLFLPPCSVVSGVWKWGGGGVGKHWNLRVFISPWNFSTRNFNCGSLWTRPWNPTQPELSGPGVFLELVVVPSHSVALSKFVLPVHG